MSRNYIYSPPRRLHGGGGTALHFYFIVCNIVFYRNTKPSLSPFYCYLLLATQTFCCKECLVDVNRAGLVLWDCNDTAARVSRPNRTNAIRKLSKSRFRYGHCKTVRVIRRKTTSVQDTQSWSLRFLSLVFLRVQLLHLQRRMETRVPHRMPSVVTQSTHITSQTGVTLTTCVDITGISI
jgi:hypothetical protein